MSATERTGPVHPDILYEITQVRIAEMRRLANQDATARAARRGHQAQTPHRRLAASLARRVINLRAALDSFGADRRRPGCQQPCPACT